MNSEDIGSKNQPSPEEEGVGRISNQSKKDISLSTSINVDGEPSSKNESDCESVDRTSSNVQDEPSYRPESESEQVSPFNSASVIQKQGKASCLSKKQRKSGEEVNSADLDGRSSPHQKISDNPNGYSDRGRSTDLNRTMIQRRELPKIISKGDSLRVDVKLNYDESSAIKGGPEEKSGGVEWGSPNFESDQCCYAYHLNFKNKTITLNNTFMVQVHGEASCLEENPRTSREQANVTDQENGRAAFHDKLLENSTEESNEPHEEDICQMVHDEMQEYHFKESDFENESSRTNDQMHLESVARCGNSIPRDDNLSSSCGLNNSAGISSHIWKFDDNKGIGANSVMQNNLSSTQDSVYLENAILHNTDNRVSNYGKSFCATENFEDNSSQGPEGEFSDENGVTNSADNSASSCDPTNVEEVREHEDTASDADCSTVCCTKYVSTVKPSSLTQLLNGIGNETSEIDPDDSFLSWNRDVPPVERDSLLGIENSAFCSDDTTATSEETYSDLNTQSESETPGSVFATSEETYSHVNTQSESETPGSVFTTSEETYSDLNTQSESVTRGSVFLFRFNSSTTDSRTSWNWDFSPAERASLSGIDNSSFCFSNSDDMSETHEERHVSQETYSGLNTQSETPANGSSTDFNSPITDSKASPFVSFPDTSDQSAQHGFPDGTNREGSSFVGLLSFHPGASYEAPTPQEDKKTDDMTATHEESHVSQETYSGLNTQSETPANGSSTDFNSPITDSKASLFVSFPDTSDQSAQHGFPDGTNREGSSFVGLLSFHPGASYEAPTPQEDKKTDDMTATHEESHVSQETYSGLNTQSETPANGSSTDFNSPITDPRAPLFVFIPDPSDHQPVQHGFPDGTNREGSLFVGLLSFHPGASYEAPTPQEDNRVNITEVIPEGNAESGNIPSFRDPFPNKNVTSSDRRPMVTQNCTSRNVSDSSSYTASLCADDICIFLCFLSQFTSIMTATDKEERVKLLMSSATMQLMFFSIIMMLPFISALLSYFTRN